MSQDRRASVRRRITLPFAWVEVAPDADTAAICDALALPRALALQSRLADLDDEVVRTTAAVSDRATAAALAAINARIALLEEAVLADAPRPPEAELELSADGIGFPARRELAIGSSIGLHLVLPVTFHAVCRARVTSCAEAAGPGPAAHRIGAEFRDLDGPLARRLTRLAISRQTAPPD